MRGVPESVLNELKRQAAAEGQELQLYLREALARLAGLPNALVLEELRARRLQGPTTEQILEAIVESRRHI